MTNTINTLNVTFQKVTAVKNGLGQNYVQWQVTINGQTFDYSEGLGHYLNMNHKLYRPKVQLTEKIEQAILKANEAEFKTPREFGNLQKDYCLFTGRIKLTGNGIKRITPPKTLDVLYCLYNDSKVDLMTFDEFCGDFGYDTDSRKAFETYNDCLDNARKFRRLNLDPQELETTFENY